VTWRDEIREIVAEVSVEELPDVIGELARAQAIASMRLRTDGAGHVPEPSTAPVQGRDRLLNTSATAELLDVKPQWLYRRADRLPFTRRLGSRTLRFSEAGILRWLETRR
jgi:predicted DNA-binding transcriptional regulator AlpA